MSTKTLRKRIALVAVAALGFGVVTGVQAQAANSVAGDMTSISLAKVTATPTVNAAVVVNVGMLMAADFTGTVKVAGALTSTPTGGYVGVTPVVGGSNGTTAFAGGDAVASGVITITNPTVAGYVAAGSAAGNFSMTFTPTVAGDYTLTVWNDAGTTPDNVIGVTEVRQTINITVAAATAFSAQLSTAYVGASTLNAAATQALTADDEVRVSSAVGTDAAMIGVKLNNSSGTAYTGGGTLDVQVVSGPGLVDAVSSGTAYADASARADTLAIAAGTSAANIRVTADGTSGTSQIRIRLLDAVTGASLGTIATKTVYFYGTVAKLVATPTYTVARANATERGCANATTCIQDTFANTPFVVIKATDSEGNLVPGLTVTAVSSNGAILGSSTVVASTVKVNTVAGATACAAGTGECNGLGYYNASVAGAVGAASGSSATFTYRTLLTGTTYITADPVTFTIGGAIAKETLSFDKSAYAPGEAMIITRTATDASGNKPYDGQGNSAVTFNKPQGGTAPAASFYVNGKKASSTSTSTATVFAPVSAGSFTASMLSAVDGVTSINATASVTDPASAAQAATDAAIASLIAKINALSKLIAKIQKKLGVK